MHARITAGMLVLMGLITASAEGQLRVNLGIYGGQAHDITTYPR